MRKPVDPLGQPDGSLARETSPLRTLSPTTRSLLAHIAVLLAGPLVLRLLDLDAARRVVVFYVALLGVAVGAIGALRRLGGRRSARCAGWMTAGYVIAAPALLFVAAIHADNTLRYGALIADSAGAIFQTDVYEALHYVLEYVSPWALAAGGVWSAAAALTAWRDGRAWRREDAERFGSGSPAGRRAGLALAALTLVSAVVAGLRADDAWLIAREAAAYRATLRDYEASRLALDDGAALREIRTGLPGHVVVVVGESLSRHHLSLYGYPRDTTPYLRARRAELAVFHDAITTSSYTVPSLLHALSFGPRDLSQPAEEMPDLLTVAQRAGFETRWISNQNAAGPWDNLIAAVARRADHTVYHSQRGGTAFEREVFDEAMLPSLEEAIASPATRKLTIVHTMATHGPYCEVIPPEYRSPGGTAFGLAMDRRFFGDYRPPGDEREQGAPDPDYVERIECYDAAVRYLDVVLDGALSRLAAASEPTILVFLADHGEAPLLATYHDGRRHSHFHVEIPLLVWANETWRARQPERWRQIDASGRRPVSLVDLSYTVADVAGIGGIAELERRSFLSPSFEPFARTTLSGRAGYDVPSAASDAVERARANLAAVCRRAGDDRCHRLWAHRVNSLGALLQAREVFAGVELDVVWDATAGVFRVHHPPAPDVGLTLAQYLRADDGALRYWLDWKNPEETTLEPALDRLRSLDERLGLRDRVLVETSRPLPSSRRIAEEGFTSSFYLPTARIRAASGDEGDAATLAAELRAQVEEHGFGAVSFDASLRPFFERTFGGAVRAGRLRAFAWAPGVEADGDDDEALTRWASDELLEVVLVGFDSAFDL